MANVGKVPFGGRHAETAAVKNVLARLGVIAPHTGEPFTEAMLLGIGGGVGGGYWVFEYKSHPDPLLSLFTRHAWYGPEVFLGALCERLGVLVVTKETTSARRAEKHLRDALGNGSPPIAWIDLASTPHALQPAAFSGAVPHIAVVCRIDDAAGTVELDDRAAVPWTMDLAELAQSRAAVRGSKHRLMVVEPPPGALDLKRAVAEGIRACYDELLSPPAHLPAWAAQNCGLAAWAKWADLLENAKDRKGWPKVFKPGRHRYQGLSQIYRAVEIESAGGAFRPMYAEFLEDASAILAIPPLQDVAAQYRALGDQWTALATAALPDAVAPFRRARELLLARHSLFLEQGAGAVPALQQMGGELAQIEQTMDQAFPLSDQEAQQQLAELAARLRGIHAAEARAAQALQVALG